MFDTHTHLQFKAFEGKVDQVIKSAQDSGVEKIIVVGTNLETSKKAVELAESYKGLYASVGVHPHHVFKYVILSEVEGSVGIHTDSSTEVGMTNQSINQLKQLLTHPKVIAIGEAGLDCHIYENTKYPNYKITEEFINLQKLFFKEQIKLAIKHQKSLIIHNREAVPELLEILEENWDPFLEGRSVFHCCEPNQRLLDFALKHKVFIGIDGDITYDKPKQDFLKKIPLELLVLETDSPYFLPEPLRLRAGGNPINNEPANLKYIAKYLTKLLNIELEKLSKILIENSNQLFNLSSKIRTA